jgi:hypothetical protein
MSPIPPPTPELLAWANTRPPVIRDAVLAHPPGCYRLKSCGGHYLLHSYSEPDPPEYPTVTVTVYHGRDSNRPGFSVFGISVDDLEWCGCGKWEPPTEEQCQSANIFATLLGGTLDPRKQS